MSKQTKKVANQALITENPEFIVWTKEDLQFDILGGIRMDGLDRLRVTLRVTYDQFVIRHNLDLYNDDALTKLVRKCAERFEMSSSFLYPIVGELVNELEDYRIKTIKSEAENQKVKKVKLSEQEAEEAEKLLTSKNLLSGINDLIGKAGVIGEIDNRLLMYIIFTSRLMANPLHIISMGASGTGKSHLQESVASLLPPEDTMSITDLSPSSFYYFRSDELCHKLLLIEDLDGAQRVLYPIRELQSKKYITKTFVEKTRQGLRTTSRTVFGPVCVAGCTTRENIYEDNSNRSFLIYIDDSENQDNLVMEYQRAISAGEINFGEQNKAIQQLRNSQRLLEPIKVINPYANQLVLPKSVFKPRRTNAHYLHFIEAVTFLHQKLRKVQVNKETGERFIETTLEDIQNANVLMKDVLLKKSDRLNPATRRYFEELKVHLAKAKFKEFTTLQIAINFSRPIPSIRRYHQTLVDNGYLKTKKKKGSKTLVYQIVDSEEYKRLERGVITELENAFKTLKIKK